MKLKERIVSYLILVLACSFIQLSAQKPTRQSAAEAFSKGNFELAYRYYGELLNAYPRDPVYKYYSAACLVNLRRDPEKAEKLIDQALNSGSLKSLPDDAVFYLARTQHMQGKYEEAEKSYNRFIAEAGRKKARELDVPAFLQQCKTQTGKIEPGRSVASAEREVAEITPEKKPVVSEVNTLPQEVDLQLADKLDQQYKADSAEAAAVARKQQAAPSLPVKTVEEAQKPAVIVPAETGEYLATNENPVPFPVQDELPAAAREAVTEVRDTSIKIREILSKPAGVFSVFEILPEPVTDPKATIEVNTEPPEGLIYRIQLAVFRNPVQLAFFKGVSPIYGIKAPGATVTTYYAGIFRQSADAQKALSAVKTKGFKDSFIVAQMANKAISSERAAVLEKEWADKPLFTTVENNITEKLDTVPPTLLLKVEVARSIQPLREEAIDPMRRMAGKRSFDMMTLENGSVAYLIGDFITFESAEEFAGLLRRNGYRDARVVAWLGKREIDIQTAKQLFETLR